MDKKIVEEYFPVKEISELSGKGRDPINSLHKWWGRSPQISSRAIIYSSIKQLQDNDIDWITIRNEIIEISQKEDFNLSEQVNNGKVPKILDPFAGGGSIPLESLRLGFESYASEYNPVAVLIEKCTLDYPQRYGSELADDFLKWMKWIFREVKDEVGKYYPKGTDNSTPIAYIWARIIPCQNPACGTEIPLMRQLWLSNKKNKKVALVPLLINDEIQFKIVDDEKNIPDGFDPGKGTVNRAIVECPACGSTIEAKLTRRLFQECHAGSKIVAVAIESPNGSKIYRIPKDEDINTFKEAEKYLEKRKSELFDKWGMDLLPDELISQGNGFEKQALSVRNYGFKKWCDLFNPRQQLVLITFVDKIRQSYENMINSGMDKEYSKALVGYMALNLGKFMHQYSGLARWNPRTENVRDLFGRPAISLRWECGEINPFKGSMPYSNVIYNFILKISKINKQSNILQSSATSLPYSDNYFDAIVTDPPYYDNLPYSFISDFFYVWFKRMVGHLYPDLFLTPLTPKKDEIISDLEEKTLEEAHKSYEIKLKKSFEEIYRVLKVDGIVAMGYTYKTTEGWEMVINSLIDSGFTITASWPIITMGSRLMSHNSAAMLSTTYIVARKIEKKDIGWFKDIKEEINIHLAKKLDHLWDEGINGPDFSIAGIGFGLEFFSKYNKVFDNKCNEISSNYILDYIRKAITDYIFKKITKNEISHNISPLTKFYLLWRWNYGEAQISFDEARKLAQSVGINLTKEWNKGFIVKKGNFIRIKGPEKRDERYIKRLGLIDYLHCICLLWKKGDQENLKLLLNEMGPENNQAMYSVAQAISESLPNSSSEKKLIDGVLLNQTMK